MFHRPPAANALTPTPKLSLTPTTSPTPGQKSHLIDNLDQQINDLKDRIASRVAQLKLVEKRGAIGTVMDISGTQITLTDLRKNTRFVDVDELTKFSSPSAKGTFGISDITKGTKLGVLGLYNKQSRRILARFVDVLVTPTVLNGAIASIDSGKFSFKMVTADEKQYTVDIENITKTRVYTKADGLTKSGFSKIAENENVLVVGFPDVKNANKIIASRIILFPDLPVNPKIVIPQAALNPNTEVTPSSGNGKKLTPIR